MTVPAETDDFELPFLDPSILIHRFKNNLQVLSSLISLLSRPESGGVPADVVHRIRGSIFAIAKAYDAIGPFPTNGNVCSLGSSFVSYLEKLLPALRSVHLKDRTPAGSLALQVNAAPHISFERMTTLGLLINEIVSILAVNGDAINGERALEIELGEASSEDSTTFLRIKPWQKRDLPLNGDDIVGLLANQAQVHIEQCTESITLTMY